MSRSNKMKKKGKKKREITVVVNKEKSVNESMILISVKTILLLNCSAPCLVCSGHFSPLRVCCYGRVESLWLFFGPRALQPYVRVSSAAWWPHEVKPQAGALPVTVFSVSLPADDKGTTHRRGPTGETFITGLSLYCKHFPVFPYFLKKEETKRHEENLIRNV